MKTLILPLLTALALLGGCQRGYCPPPKHPCAVKAPAVRVQGKPKLAAQPVAAPTPAWLPSPQGLPLGTKT